MPDWLDRLREAGTQTGMSPWSGREDRAVIVLGSDLWPLVVDALEAAESLNLHDICECPSCSAEWDALKAAHAVLRAAVEAE